jgi:hypothetical protein
MEIDKNITGIPIDEFGRRIKKKYGNIRPDFNDVDDAQLGRIFLQHNPKYRPFVNEYLDTRALDRIVKETQKTPSEPKDYLEKVKEKFNRKYITGIPELQTTLPSYSQIVKQQEIDKKIKEEIVDPLANIGKFGLALGNAIASTPIKAMMGRTDLIKQDWDLVKEAGEKADEPLSKISDALTMGLLVHDIATVLPFAYEYYIKHGSLGNLYRKLTIPERGLATISDEQLLNIFKDIPKQVEQTIKYDISKLKREYPDIVVKGKKLSEWSDKDLAILAKDNVNVIAKEIQKDLVNKNIRLRELVKGKISPEIVERETKIKKPEQEVIISEYQPKKEEKIIEEPKIFSEQKIEKQEAIKKPEEIKTIQEKEGFGTLGDIEKHKIKNETIKPTEVKSTETQLGESKDQLSYKETKEIELGTKSIPKELEPLAEELKKHIKEGKIKSAEDFVLPKIEEHQKLEEQIFDKLKKSVLKNKSYFKGGAIDTSEEEKKSYKIKDLYFPKDQFTPEEQKIIETELNKLENTDLSKLLKHYKGKVKEFYNLVAEGDEKPSEKLTLSKEEVISQPENKQDISKLTETKPETIKPIPKEPTETKLENTGKSIQEKKYATPEDFIKALKPEEMFSLSKMSTNEKLEIFKSETNIENLEKGLNALKQERENYLKAIKEGKEKRNVNLLKLQKKFIEEAENHLNEIKEKQILSTKVTQKELDDFLNKLEETSANNIIDQYTFYKRLNPEQIDYLLDKLTEGGKFKPFLTEKDFKSKLEYKKYLIKDDVIRHLLEVKTGKYPQVNTYWEQLSDFYKQLKEKKSGTETENTAKEELTTIKEPKQLKIKPERKIKQKRKIEDIITAVKRLTAGEARNPILKNVVVKNGKLQAISFFYDVMLIKNTDLPDGVYEIIGKNFDKTDIDISEYPKFDVDLTKFKSIAKVKADDFVKAFNMVKNSIEKKEYNYISDILLEIKNGKAKLVATNGKILSIREFPINSGVDGKYFLNGNIEKVINALEGQNFELRYNFDDNAISILTDDGEIIAKNRGGNFHNYEKEFLENEKQMIVNTNDFNNALKEIEPYIKVEKDKNPKIRIQQIANNKLKISYVGNKYKKEIEIPIKFNEIKELKIDGNLIMPYRHEEIPEEIRVFGFEDIKSIMNNIATDFFELNYKIPTMQHQFIDTDKKIEKTKPILGSQAMPKTEEYLEFAKKDKVEGEYKELARAFVDEVMQPVFEKYKGLFAEKGFTYMPQGALGVFYPDTGNLFVDALNHLRVGIHELTHKLDWGTKLHDEIMKHSISKLGRRVYSKETRDIRKALTNVYVHYYPGGKSTHKLEKRVTEGLAKFIELYATKPQLVDEDLELLKKEILTPGGRFYNEVIRDFAIKAKQFYKKYILDKSPLAQIKDSIYKGEMSEIGRNSGSLNWDEKIIRQIQDANVMLAKITKEMGYSLFSEKSPYLFMDLSKKIGSNLLEKIVTPGEGMYIINKDGELIKFSDVNLADLMIKIRDNGDNPYDVASAFIAARYKGMIDRAKELEKTLKELEEKKLTDTDLYNQIKEEYVDLKSILSEEGVNEEFVELAYNEGKPFLDKYDEDKKKIFKILPEMLKIMGRISEERYNQMLVNIDKYGYVSFKRNWYDEFSNGEREIKIPKGSTWSYSMLKELKGSRLQKLPFWHSFVYDYAEIISKMFKTMAMNKLHEFYEERPDIMGKYMQQVPLKTTVDDKGRVIYPQLNDKNLVFAWQDGKPIPYVIDPVLQQTIFNVSIIPEAINIYVDLFRAFSRTFVVLTTGIFPTFAITNIFMDMLTAIANTETKYNPIIDRIRVIKSMIKEKIIHLEDEDWKYVEEYIKFGGYNFTLVDHLNKGITPDELQRKLIGEQKWFEKIMETGEKVLDVLSKPGEFSESLSRLPEYIKARKQGDSILVAMEKAASITGPFHRKGYWGGIGSIVSTIPYFNPNIQEPGYEYERIKYGGEKAKYRILAVLLGIATINLAIFYYLINSASKEQIENYLNIDPEIKSNYLLIPLPIEEWRKTGRLFRLRISSIFQSIINAMLMPLIDKWYKDAKIPYSVNDYLQSVSSFLPEQFNILMLLNDTSSNTLRLIASWLPYPLSQFPLLLGYKTYPQLRKIVPEKMKYMTKEEKLKNYGEMLAYLSEKTGMHPAEIKEIIRNVVGGRTALFYASLFGVGPKYTSPFIQDFYASFAYDTVWFYKAMDKLEEAKKKKKEGIELNNYDEKLLSVENNFKELHKELKELRNLSQEEQAIKYSNINDEIIKLYNYIEGGLQ